MSTEDVNREDLVRWSAWLERRVKTLENEIECACNAITDSVLCSGNDPATTLHFVRKLSRTARRSNDELSDSRQ